MQHAMIIYLHTYDTIHPSWVLFDKEGKLKDSVRHGDPAQLAELARDAAVTIVVPAEDVLLTTATLPKMSRARLINALPYALEEHLITEVDALHFAAGSTLANGELPVAVVSKAKMQEWLTLLETWQIQADNCVPMSLTLPVTDNTWHIVINGTAMVRTSQYSGFACDKNNLRELLTLALASANPLPQQIQIHNYSQKAYTRELGLAVPVQEYMKQNADLYADLASLANQAPAINLLQGAYKTKKSKFPQMQKLWKATAYLAVAWVFLLFLYPTISYFILKQRVSVIDSQIAQIYKRNFPQATSIVAPETRMQEKLERYSTQTSADKLLVFLNYIGKAIGDRPSVKLKRLDYNSGSITLDITAGSSEDFAAFVTYMQQQGLKVKQQNANLIGARIGGVVVFD